MQQQQDQKFGIAEARRVLDDVFAPWVKDLDLSVEAFDFEQPSDERDWQAGAVLRMPFSEKLCRNGGMVCGQALMAFADTAMVIANLAANRGYRPMTTVDQTTHFMRAVMSSDVLADARDAVARPAGEARRLISTSVLWRRGAAARYKGADQAEGRRN